MGIWLWLVILGGIGVVLVLREAARYLQGASPVHVAEVIEGILRIQQAAFDNVVEPGNERLSPEVRGAREARFMENQYFVSSQGVGVGYAIVRADDVYVHQLSMRAENPDVGRKRIAQLMMVAMGAIMGELDMFNEEERPRYHLSETIDGTHQLTFELTPEQHVAFRDAAAPPPESRQSE